MGGPCITVVTKKERSKSERAQSPTIINARIPAEVETALTSLRQDLDKLELALYRVLLPIADRLATAKRLYDAATGSGQGKRRSFRNSRSFVEVATERLGRGKDAIYTLLRIAELDADTRKLIEHHPRLAQHQEALETLVRIPLEHRAQGVDAYAREGMRGLDQVSAKHRQDVRDAISGLVNPSPGAADVISPPSDEPELPPSRPLKVVSAHLVVEPMRKGHATPYKVKLHDVLIGVRVAPLSFPRAVVESALAKGDSKVQLDGVSVMVEVMREMFYPKNEIRQWRPGSIAYEDKVVIGGTRPNPQFDSEGGDGNDDR